LFILLLVLSLFAPAQASPICAKPVMNCGGACGMDCCATKPASDSQPAPAVPAQASVQNQIPLLASAAVAWILPSHETNLISSVTASSLITMAAPLYARNCSLLL
jgi:hypothetical protein